jgi:hypothetical protein
MEQLRDALDRLWKLFWGKPYYRYCALLLTTGAGLASGPALWQTVIDAGVWLLSIVLETRGYEPPDFAAGSLIAQLAGLVLCALSVGLFVFFHLRDVPSEEAWESIRATWNELRDIHDDPQQADAEDLALALNAVNDAASTLQRNTTLLARFREEHGKSYCLLFCKLSKRPYVVRNMGCPASELLTPTARALAAKLECV